MIDTLLPKLQASFAFLREFARVGIDPLAHRITWQSTLLPVSVFLRVVSTVNTFRASKPSMHQSVFGKDGDLSLSMHAHNWFHTDDDVSEEVRRWQEWGVNEDCQIQLVSLLQTFNSRGVLAAMQAVESKSSLPKQHGQTIVEQASSVDAFLRQVLARGNNVFSIRFNAQAHNACLDCKHKLTDGAEKALAQGQRKVLSAAEAHGLGELKTYKPKLQLLARIKGFSEDRWTCCYFGYGLERDFCFGSDGSAANLSFGPDGFDLEFCSGPDGFD